MAVSPLIPTYVGASTRGAGVPVREPSPGLPGVTAGGFVDAGDYWNRVSALAIASSRAVERLGSQVLQVAENDAQRDMQLVQADARMRLHSAASGAYVQLKDLESSIATDPSISPQDAGARWRESAEKIRDEFAKDLAGEPLKAFTEDVDRQIGLAAIRFRERGVDRLKDSAAAGLQTTLDGLATAAVKAGTPAELSEAVGRAQDVMHDAVANGVLTETQAAAMSRKWRGNVDEARLRAAIDLDPAAAIKRIDAGEFPGLPVDQLQQFRAAALADADQRFRHKEVLAERDRRDLEDATYKGILDQSIAGTLTMERVQAQRDHLSVTQYQTALRLAQPDRREDYTDPTTYLGLSRAVSNGADVRDLVDAAWADGKLKREDRDRLWSEFEKQRDAGRKYGRERAADLLGKPSMLTGEDASFMALKEQARQSFSDWYDDEVEKGKVPSQTEIETKSRQVGEIFATRIGVPSVDQIKGDWAQLRSEIAAFGKRRIPADKALEFGAREQRIRDWAQRRGVTLE